MARTESVPLHWVACGGRFSGGTHLINKQSRKHEKIQRTVNSIVVVVIVLVVAVALVVADIVVLELSGGHSCGRSRSCGNSGCCWGSCRHRLRRAGCCWAIGELVEVLVVAVFGAVVVVVMVVVVVVAVAVLGVVTMLVVAGALVVADIGTASLS